MNKQKSKIFLSILTILVFFFCSFADSELVVVSYIYPGAKAAETELFNFEQMQKGDLIDFGSYPQNEETDPEIIKALNSIASDWKSYGYYSGNGSPGSMVQGDWMKYCDITLNGIKYRGINFTKYRTDLTISDNPNDPDISKQYENRFYLNTNHWFVYEPLTWRVIDPSEGFVLCLNIIDSQAYQNVVYVDNEKSYDGYAYDYKTYNNPEKTVYANDYVTSSIRKWLNDDFYNIAFTSEEKAKIGITELDNSALPGCYEFDSKMTRDKIFLMSCDEMTNTNYGFKSLSGAIDFARQANCTNYAKSQGLMVTDYSPLSGNTSYWLRTAEGQSKKATVVMQNGGIQACENINNTSYGVRPALKFNPKPAHIQGDVNGDKRITSADARSALRIALKLDYVSTAVVSVSDVNGDNKVTTTDARIILRVALKLQDF